jgi:radical SAM protein with 4Fe4S-binding SPASM domain
MVLSEPMKSLSNTSFTTGIFPTMRCTNISNVVMVLPNGDTTICGHLPNYTMGNVRERSISDIWDGTSRKELMDRLHKQLFPVCQNCTFFSNTLTPAQLLSIALKHHVPNSAQ